MNQPLPPIPGLLALSLGVDPQRETSIFGILGLETLGHYVDAAISERYGAKHGYALKRTIANCAGRVVLTRYRESKRCV